MPLEFLLLIPRLITTLLCTDLQQIEVTFFMFYTMFKSVKIEDFWW
jgi:hypothetical protein